MCTVGSGRQRPPHREAYRTTVAISSTVHMSGSQVYRRLAGRRLRARARHANTHRASKAWSATDPRGRWAPDRIGTREVAKAVLDENDNAQICQRALGLDAPPPPLFAGADRHFAVGEDKVARVHRSLRTWRQEAHALRVWSPQLVDLAPHWLGGDEASRVIIMTRVPGDGWTRDQGDTARTRRVLHDVGKLLATLHALPLGTHVDPLPLSEAIAQRVAACRARARGFSETRDWADALPADVDVWWSDTARVPCHRDNQPRNWLVDDAGVARIVDFEHSRPDHWMSDLVKLPDELPALESDAILDAVLTGYGRRDVLGTQTFTACWNAWRMLHGLTTWTWGLEHEDAAFIVRGRAIVTPG